MKQKQIKVLEYNTIFEAEKDGGFSVWVPSLAGCASQGETFEEATKNIKEAISLYLEGEKHIEPDNVSIFNFSFCQCLNCL
jgi:predicted RNase H-like HicB family nuclease